jgi:hypothetical protein
VILGTNSDYIGGQHKLMIDFYNPDKMFTAGTNWIFNSLLANVENMVSS